MNDHGRDIPTIGRQGDAPPPEREYDNTPVWGKVTDVAWDLDEAGKDHEAVNDCAERLKEIVGRLRIHTYLSRHADKLWLIAGELEAAVWWNPAGTDCTVVTDNFPAIVDTLDEIAGELHEELFVKRGIVL